MYVSLRENCPDFRLWILCMDEFTYELLQKLQLERVTIIRLTNFENQELLKIKPQRTWAEYCWTCTPALLEYVFRYFPEVDSLSYLDADLYFYSSPEPIFSEMGRKSVMIIPHRFVPWKKTKEKEVGIYNVSMLTFRRDKNGLACLEWWRNSCLKCCALNPGIGQVGDQKYLDEFPKRFKGVHVLKHLGAGVATWNVPQYKATQIRGKVFIDDYPLIFFHFQGLRIYAPAIFLTKVPPGSYGDRIIYRKLIYNKYFDAIYRAAGTVRKYSRGFSLGFVLRPKLGQYGLEIARDLVGQGRELISKNKL